MPDPAQIALDRYRTLAQVSAGTRAAVTQLWRQVDRSAIGPSWLRLVPVAAVVVEQGQLAAVAGSDRYVGDLAAAQGTDGAAAGRLVTGSLAGVASDGRDLTDLLVQPAFTALTALDRGYPVARALDSGLAALRMITATQVMDAGRVADSVSGVGRRSLTGYVRVVSAGACSRCTILAGKFYRWNRGFLRHPHCHCVHAPAAAPAAVSVRGPRETFDSLSAAEQTRTFGRAGAQAIRDGADPAQVVNARRGMTVAGRNTGTTTEGTTRRGLFGGYQTGPDGRLVRRTDRPPPRLMPEEIYRRSGGDRDEAIRLLREHAYLT